MWLKMDPQWGPYEDLFGLFSAMQSHYPMVLFVLPIRRCSRRPDTGLGLSHQSPNITTTILYRWSSGLPEADVSLL